MSRASRLLTCSAGAFLLGVALAIPGYALAAGEQLSGIGWLTVVLLGLAGVLLLRRATGSNEPRRCPRCGTAVPRDLAVCPRCSLDANAASWAAIGKLKLP
jgi:hypothetical protein